MARGIWFVSHFFARSRVSARESHAFHVLFSHIRVFFYSLNVQKHATKSDISGHCLGIPSDLGGTFKIYSIWMESWISSTVVVTWGLVQSFHDKEYSLLYVLGFLGLRLGVPSNQWSLIVKGSVHASIKALAFRSVWGMRVETTHCLPQQHLQWTWTSEIIQAPHYLFRDIWAVKIFTTRWSDSSLPAGRIRVWVQVWAPAGHLAITPEGHSRGNQWPALWAALQHRLNGSKLGLTNTNTGRFRVSDSCCWQGPAHLRKSATTLAILT